MGYEIEKFIKSWKNTTGNVNKTEDLLAWVQKLNKETFVNITETNITSETFWFYDIKNGIIKNRQGSFFQISGIKEYRNDLLVKEQPIILQNEIGFLGIIAKEIAGEINFLMQAKIEPGNINKIQISPTIQATKSNFTALHGGNKPNYLDYFESAYKHTIVYDQIQSEQGARFLKKRNRNMLIIVSDDIEIKKNFSWMTLGQIKELMKIDNLVNMDTRTVISGIPFGIKNEKISDKYFKDKALYNSIYSDSVTTTLPQLYNKINNTKMFSESSTELVALSELDSWYLNEQGVFSKEKNDFVVKFYDIEIEGREVRKWMQPLFKAEGMATFGLLMKNINNVKHFLVKIEKEIGTFDIAELGPTIQWESVHTMQTNEVEKIFLNYLEKNAEIKYHTILSEEGGRFYHEQNKNYIIEISENELCDLPDEYLWIDYATLIYMMQINNTLNIQLRNLLSLIQI